MKSLPLKILLLEIQFMNNLESKPMLMPIVVLRPQI